MNKPRKLRIKIEFIDDDGEVVGEEKTLELNEDEFESIDECEQKLLLGSYDTMRRALSSHISMRSKKKEPAKK